MKTGIAFSKTQFCYDTSKYAPLFNIARYNGNDFWEVARFVVRIMEMGNDSYKQDEIYIASGLVNGKANIYMKNISQILLNGENALDYFVTEGQKYYTFYVKATTINSQVVAHVVYSNNIGFLQAVPYEYFNKTRPSKYFAVDGQSHSGGTDQVTPDPDPDPTPTPDPNPNNPTITLVQSDAWIDGSGAVFDDGGKNEYDVIRFTATGNTTYSYNYTECINPTGSRIVFKRSNGNTQKLEKNEIPTNGQFTTPESCIEVKMSIKYGSKDSLNMHTV